MCAEKSDAGLPISRHKWDRLRLADLGNGCVAPRPRHRVPHTCNPINILETFDGCLHSVSPISSCVLLGVRTGSITDSSRSSIQDTFPHESINEQELASGREETQDQLTVDDLRFVIKAVHRVRHNWNSIGHSLLVHGCHDIKKRFPNDPLKCLIAVLTNWLQLQYNRKKNPKLPSWRALASIVGGSNPQKGEYIARHYKELWRFNPCDMAMKADASMLVSDDDDKDTVEALVAEMADLLNRVVARWNEIGVLLGVHVSDLNVIQSDASLSLKERFYEMLNIWLTSGSRDGVERSWRVLVDAVQHQAGGNNPAEAMKIAKRHPAKELEKVDTPVPRKQPVQIHVEYRPFYHTIKDSIGYQSGRGIYPSTARSRKQVFAERTYESQPGSDVSESMSESLPESQSECDGREFQHVTTTESQYESESSEYSHSHSEQVIEKLPRKTSTNMKLEDKEDEDSTKMIKHEQIVFTIPNQKQEYIHTSFIMDFEQFSESTLKNDDVIGKDVKDSLKKGLGSFTVVIVDLENKFFHLLHALRNSRLATEREAVLEAQLFTLEEQMECQRQEFEERLEEHTRVEEVRVHEVEERMRREIAAEAEALHERWSHMFLETLNRIATTPQLEFAEPPSEASRVRRHASDDSSSRNIAGNSGFNRRQRHADGRDTDHLAASPPLKGTQKPQQRGLGPPRSSKHPQSSDRPGNSVFNRRQRNVDERDTGNLAASPPLKGTQKPQQRGRGPPRSSKHPQSSARPGSTPSVPRRPARRIPHRMQDAQNSSSDDDLFSSRHHSISVAGNEDEGMILVIYSSTKSQPNDVQNHMVVTLFPEEVQQLCTQNMERELLVTFPGERFSTYPKQVKLVEEKMHLRCRRIQGPLTCRLIPNSTEISRRQILSSIRNGSRCPVYLVLTVTPSERRDDVVFQVEILGLDEQCTHIWVVYKNTLRQLLLQPQDMHIPTANQLTDDVAPLIARTHKWFTLGLVLLLDAATLQEIGKLNPHRDSEGHLYCSKCMLLLWKSQFQRQATWAALIGALREIGEAAAAIELEQMRGHSQV